MPMTSIPRRAFTMIELLVAVGLGSLVVLVAVAGLRSAAGAVTHANRLSLDNALLRAGYLEAQDQLDFWTNLDDPTDSGRQQLRQRNNNAGMPFLPMRSAFVLPNGGTGSGTPRLLSPRTVPGSPVQAEIWPRAKTTFTDSAWEGDVGWDPTYAWAPHDPRTWYRGNLCDKKQEWLNIEPDRPQGDWKVPVLNRTYPQLLFGRYALFTNSEENPTFYAFSIDAGEQVMGDVPAPDDRLRNITYQGSAPHRWYERQVRGLFTALGFAAMCEYLPPNAIYYYHRNKIGGFPGQNDTSPAGIFSAFIDPGWNGMSSIGKFTNNELWQTTPRGIYQQTFATSFGYFNPRAITADGNRPTPAELRNWHYLAHQTDAQWGWTEEEMRRKVADLNERIAYPEYLLGDGDGAYRGPLHWPRVSVGVGRLIKNGHHVALARIRRHDPFTGGIIELSWAGLGTTLRGARMQRHRDEPRWANWDNAAIARNDPHLDTP